MAIMIASMYVEGTPMCTSTRGFSAIVLEKIAAMTKKLKSYLTDTELKRSKMDHNL